MDADNLTASITALPCYLKSHFGRNVVSKNCRDACDDREGRINMAFVNLASFASQWRGYTYYENRKVRSCRQAADGQYEGMVSGSNGMIYQVKINLEHPRSSQCTCPHAAGKRIVYFTDFIGIASSAIIISRNPVFFYDATGCIWRFDR